MKPFETIERKDIFTGKIIDVKLDTIALPDGKTALRELVFHGDGVGVLAVTDNNKIILVKQHRKPIEEEIYEIPAGLVEKGEDTERTALRELEEETGYIAEKITYLFGMYVSPGFCNEQIHLYYAQNLKKSTQNFDEDEFIELFEFSVEEVDEMIRSHKIKDGKTIAAFYFVKNELLKNEI